LVRERDAVGRPEDPDAPALPPLPLALLPIVVTVALLMLQLFVFDDFTPHVPLALGIFFTGVLGRLQGCRWHHLEAAMFRVVAVGLPSLAILMTVGMIIGVWILSGTVPLLIYWGLAILSPGIFLVATCLICALISLATGTSWGTVGTVGLALLGIGSGLDVPPAITAGAVVSGAFFGDKMSPLSDTTNLATAVCSTDLFTHIRGMMATAGPAMGVALLVYAGMGLGYGAEDALRSERIARISAALERRFVLSPWLLLPPVVVVGLAVRRFPALPSIFAGVVLGGVLAVVIQGVSVHEVFAAMQEGYESHTGVEAMDALLSKGGIQSMTWVITLVLFALGFGGMLEGTRALEAVLLRVERCARGRLGLVAASTGAAVGTNLVTGDVYLSVALPGRMFTPAYQRRGLATTTLSRSIEDGGTLISPLIPWNVGGAFVASTLGVETLAYAPFAFACWMSLFFGLAWAAFGWFIPPMSPHVPGR